MTATAAESDQHVDPLRVGCITLEPDAFRVHVDGHAIALSAQELKLLRVLMSNAGRVLSRRTLLDDAWGVGYPDHNKTLEVHVRRLRVKLDDGAGASPIRTVRGVGYIFDRP